MSILKIKKKIQNTSKVIVFTRNHTDNDEDTDDDDDGTKNNMSPLGRGGGDIILPSVVINLHNEAAERNDPVTTRLVKLCECWESVAVLN